MVTCHFWESDDLSADALNANNVEKIKIMWIFKIATWQISTVKTWSRSNYLSNEICLKCHTQLFNDELGRFWCQKWQYSDEQSSSAFVSIWTFSLSTISSFIQLMVRTCHFLKIWWRVWHWSMTSIAHWVKEWSKFQSATWHISTIPKQSRSQ